MRQNLRLEWLSGDPSPHGCLLSCSKASKKVPLLEVSPGRFWVSQPWGMVIRAHIHQAVPLSKEDFTASK